MANCRTFRRHDKDACNNAFEELGQESYRAKLQQNCAQLGRPSLQPNNKNSKRIPSKEPKKTNRNQEDGTRLKHLIRAIRDAVEVPHRDPPAEGGADLEESSQDQEGLPAVDGGDQRQVVRVQELGLG